MTKTYETVLLSRLIPYANNPRKNDDAVPAVEASIEQVGYITPIVVDENYEVLAGHTRLKALNAMGTKEAEVLIVEGLTDEEKRKYRILDNKTSDFAEWDVDLLEIELADLDFGDFDFGFDAGESFTETEDRTGNMAQKFLVPPFSVIRGNKGEWLDRKRKWIDFGIRSEVGRGGNLLTIQGAIQRQTSYTTGGGTERSKAYKNNERLNSYMRSRSNG